MAQTSDRLQTTNEEIVALPVGDLRTLLPTWRRSLKVKGLSPTTQRNYTETGRRFVEFLIERGIRPTAGALTREHVEMYIEHVLDSRSASTAATVYRHLQQLFRWCEEIGEITGVGPMARMKAPIVPKVDRKMPPIEHVAALLRVCSGREFEDRRDTAQLRVLFGNGLRVGELISMTVEGTPRDPDAIQVRRKGGDTQWVPVADDVAIALDLYRSARAGHKKANRPEWWLGVRGPMTESGVLQMLERRCNEANIPVYTPHQFRHLFAHLLKVHGASREDLKTLGNWKSDQMLEAYGRTAAAERAAETLRRLNLGADL